MVRHIGIILAIALSAGGGIGDDGSRLLRVDHYVRVRSAVPAISGQDTEIYVREVAEAGTVMRGGPAADRVALFVHGAARRPKSRSTSRTRITAGWPTSRSQVSTSSRWT